MNRTHRLLCAVLLAGTALTLRGTAQVSAPPTPSTLPPAASERDEEVIELSPFSVDASEDSGYRAINTLAGTRLNTKISDVASSISVVTEEMFRDLGATDATTILQYTGNTETGGYQGTIADAAGETQGARAEPHNQQRVRGLSSASLTRNFFLTNIPFDSYNTSRLTISRGPNALLFGIGRPGGVIDNSLSAASLTKNDREVVLRVGEYGSNRVSLNANQVLLDGRLGFRLAALRSRTDYLQKPAYEDVDRYYLAMNLLLRKGGDGFLGDTSLRGNFENGTIVSNRPSTIPNTSAINEWFEGPDPARYAPYNINVPAQLRPGTFQPKYTFDNRVAQVGARPALVGRPQSFGLSAAPFFDSDGSTFSDLFPGSTAVGFFGQVPAFGTRPVYDFLGTIEYGAGTPFQIRGGRNTPYEVFDSRKRMLVGGGFEANQDFDAWNFTLEQSLLKGAAGLEYSFDKQTYETDTYQGGHNTILGWVTIDVNRFLPDGTPNPNVGRPYVREHVTNRGTAERRSESNRLTAFYEVDLSRRDGWLGTLGRHRFTGLLSDQTLFEKSAFLPFRWDVASSQSYWPNRPLANFGRNVNLNIYVGPSLLDPSIQSLADVRLTGATNIPVTRDGDSYRIRAWNQTANRFDDVTMIARETLEGSGLSREEIDSKVLAWQGYLLDEHIVALVGWRDDTSTRFGARGATRLEDNQLDPGQVFRFSPNPLLTVRGRTWTKSVVAKLPDRWNPVSRFAGISAHWGESENFSPGSQRRNIRGELIAPESGVTDEVGVSFSMLENRLYARLNWYDTAQTNSTSIGVGGTNNFFNLTRGYLQRFLNAERTLNIPFAALRDYAFPVAARSRYNSYNDIYNAILALNSGPVGELVNMRIVGNEAVIDSINEFQISDTRDLSAKGLEFEIGGEIVRNWSVSLNVAKQEAIVSNVVPTWGPFVFETADTLREIGFWDAFTNDWNLLAQPGGAPVGQETALRNQFFSDVFNNALLELSREGQLNNEIRRWRANLVTNYTFSNESRFRGIGIGGALRWQDKVAIGYPSALDPTDNLWKPVIDSPYFGPSELNGDAWVSYARPLNDKIRWKVQLNIRNLVADRDRIPVRANVDGVIDVLRDPPPREIFLTNTFNF